MVESSFPMPNRFVTVPHRLRLFALRFEPSIILDVVGTYKSKWDTVSTNMITSITHVDGPLRTRNPAYRPGVGREERGRWGDSG